MRCPQNRQAPGLAFGRLFTTSIPWSLIALVVTMLVAPATSRGQSPFSSPPLDPNPEVTNVPAAEPRVLDLWKRFYSRAGLMGRNDSQVPLEAYLAIARQWSEGDSIQAVELNAHFGLRLVSEGPCFRYEVERALEHWGESNPQALLGASYFQLETWTYQLEHRHFNHLQDNLQRVHRSAKSFAQEVNTPLARRQAAVLLTYLADYLWESGFVDLLPRAVRVLNTAVDLDPDYPTARRLRAMVLEKSGRYRRALSDFEVLSKQQPDRDDVRLGLAVQLARTDKEDRATRLFDTLTAEDSGAQPWIRVVAFQEWIRMENRRSQPAAADRLLHRARLEFPQNQRLAILAMGTTGSPRDLGTSRGKEILRSWLGDQGPTPRLRYLQGAIIDLEANRDLARIHRDSSRPSFLRSTQALQSRNRGTSVPCIERWRFLAIYRGEVMAENTSGEPTSSRATSSRATSSRARLPTIPAPNPVPPSRPATATPPTPAAEPTPLIQNIGNVWTDPDTGKKILIHDKVDLDLQSVYVTASRFGRPIDQLQEQEVKVFDQGRAQKVVTFAQGNIPFTATLLIDASGSMRGPRLERALEGARSFVAAIGEHDRARVLLAADRLRGVSPLVGPDASASELMGRLDQAGAEGGTALFDHLYLSLQALRPELGRKVIIVLSDGYDLMSVIPVRQVREQIKRHQVQLYWVRLRQGSTAERSLIPPTAWRPQAQTRSELNRWRRAVKDSGGRVVDIDHPGQVADAFAGIVDELRRQLAIGYYPDPPQTPQSWREIRIEVKRKGVRARHAIGYYQQQ